MDKAQARILALSEIKRNHPQLFAAALRATKSEIDMETMGYMPPTYPGALGEAEPSLWDKLSQNLMKIGGAYLSIKNQKDLMDINLERATQGLPPLDAGSTAPVLRTQVDLPPDLVNQIRSEASMSLNKILMFGGVAIVAFMLIKKMK